MATFKSFVFIPEVALCFCCLMVLDIDNMTGVSSQPCLNIPWNETFWDKVYYILQSASLTSYKYQNVARTCDALGIQKLVIDSQAENDFIVETMTKYQPHMDSKVFLACPSDGVSVPPNRTFNCRNSKAEYKEETYSATGFWNWRDGQPAAVPGGCMLLDTADGAWTVSNCGLLSNFIICQCRRGLQPGTFVSTRYHERAFGSKNCLHPDLILRVVPVDNFIQCAMECLSDGSCASFNMREGVTSQINCQLSLYHSSIVDETSFILKENCRYYERML